MTVFLVFKSILIQDVGLSRRCTRCMKDGKHGVRRPGGRGISWAILRRTVTGGRASYGTEYIMKMVSLKQALQLKSKFLSIPYVAVTVSELSQDLLVVLRSSEKLKDTSTSSLINTIPLFFFFLCNPQVLQSQMNIIHTAYI